MTESNVAVQRVVPRKEELIAAFVVPAELSEARRLVQRVANTPGDRSRLVELSVAELRPALAG
jgi:hypothetical protein